MAQELAYEIENVGGVKSVALAVERGLYVLSELPASGELRIEHG